MNVLSLFDGISCGRLALERAGINVTNYYSSEIDKYAILVSKHNYPQIHRLGDVVNVKGSDLPKIDLLIGGSPCQGFSFAGKGLAFDDPRSKLFFEFVRLLNECKPKYFLLENVRMKKEYQDIISELLGVEPICINSALVSAQNRVRYYWTNIPSVTQPSDKGIILDDILESGVSDRHKSYCIDANYWKGGNLKNYLYKKRRQSEKRIRVNDCIEMGKADFKGKDILKRIYSTKGKSPALTAVCGGHQEKKIAVDDSYWRKLTPLECERLQTLPDNYTQGISNTQRYKSIGNGWTVDIIAHILKGIMNYREFGL